MLAFVGTFLLGCSTETVQDDLTASEEKNLSSKLVWDALDQYDWGKAHHDLQARLMANRGRDVTKTIKIRTEGATYPIQDITVCFPNSRVVYEGEGNATHLGLFALELSYCVDKGGNPIAPPPYFGTQTAANGDQLFVKLVGGDNMGTLYFEYYDGTGRFIGAEGYVELHFTFYEDGTWSNYGEGHLTY